MKVVPEAQFDEWWDDADVIEDEDPDSDIVPCPHCGAEVYEDAPRCPDCGDFIVLGGSAWSGRPAWWVLLAILGFLATLVTLILSR